MPTATSSPTEGNAAPGTPTPTALPQVGGLLHLNSHLHHDDLLYGNRHWRLDGSCVLVAPTYALGIYHTIQKQGPKAAFFPGIGIVLIAGQEREERQKVGDNVVLLQLARPIHIRRLRPAHLHKATLRCAAATGFGAWTCDDRALPDGVQRSAAISLKPEYEPPKKAGAPNLDLYWQGTDNHGVRPQRNNSGGPILTPNGDRVVGLIRERRDDVMAGSRITGNRNVWLEERLGEPTQLMATPAVFTSQLLSLGTETLATQLAVPPGSRRAHLTLSATSDLRLQMNCSTAPLPVDTWNTLQQTTSRSGRFLYRHHDLGPNQSTVFVAIAVVGNHYNEQPDATLQLCVGWE